MMSFDKDLVSIQEARQKVERAKKAQAEFATFTQKKIDEIIHAMTVAAERNAVELAKAAKEETGFGNWQDKVLKNTFAARVVYDYIQPMKTVGVIKENKEKKLVEVGVPVGVICALIPSTNPTSTVIYKALISLKAGNAVIFSPHPKAKNCILQTVRILQDAAVRSGAPEGIISVIETPTIDATNTLMKHPDVNMILATGGGGMVRAAYSSGTPALGVGPGNGPAFIEKSADIPKAIERIVASRTFDNGVICASEQSIVVEKIIEKGVKHALENAGGYFMNEQECEALGKFLLRPNLTINPQVVGKSALEIGEMMGWRLPSGTKVLVAPQTDVSHTNPYSREKLCPIVAYYVVDDWRAGRDQCLELLANEGSGHTMTIHSKNEDIIREFGLKMTVSRFLVNTSAALGGIGATTNLAPSLTLGCGAVGGTATSDNVSPLHLMNVKTIAYGVSEVADLRKDSPQEVACSNNQTGNVNNVEKDLEAMIERALRSILTERI